MNDRAAPLNDSARQETAGSGALDVSRVRPAYQQVADQLLTRILDGTLTAGHRLPSETELTAMFGVSRSTVREALRVLASRDLVETSRGTGGGTFVRRVELEQVGDYLQTSLGLISGSKAVPVADMLDAREILEVPAARMAADRREEEHLVALTDAVELELQERHVGRRFREHHNFHSLVLQSAQNPLLEVMTEPLYQILQTKFLDPDLTPDFWAGVDQDHQRILTAIRDQDAAAAAAAMQDHLSKVRGAYRDLPLVV